MLRARPADAGNPVPPVAWPTLRSCRTTPNSVAMRCEPGHAAASAPPRPAPDRDQPQPSRRARPTGRVPTAETAAAPSGSPVRRGLRHCSGAPSRAASGGPSHRFPPPTCGRPPPAPAHFWLGSLAAKSCCKRLGAMLNVWSLSVVALNLWVLTTQIAFCRIRRPTLRCPTRKPDTQARHASPTRKPDTQARLVQLFRHSGATIAALAQSVLIANMRQKHHVAPLLMRYRPMLPSP